VLADNISLKMIGTTHNVMYRHAAHCTMCDADYGRRVCEAMDLDTAKAMALSKLSHNDLMAATGMEMRPSDEANAATPHPV